MPESNGKRTKSDRIMEREARVLVGRPGHAQRIVWERARADEVTDADGKTYIDFTSGVLVTNLGHCHPKLVIQLQNQLTTLMNCYDSPHENRARAAEAIVSHADPPLERVAFFSTGSESLEAGVKLARAFTGRHEIISFHGGFHGKTYLGMSLAGNEDLRRNFGPFTPSVHHAPFPYCYRCPVKHEPPDCPLHSSEYLDWILKTETASDVAAIVVEPYQGAGGCVLPPDGFFQSLRGFCDEHGILLILDEVQAGFGRTGSWFAYQQLGIVPDVVCVAKGLANGMPTSALITTAAISESVPRSAISSTYGGNPISCAAITATIDTMEEETVLENCRGLSGRFEDGLRRLLDFDFVGEVRTWGLVCGVEFVQDRESKVPAPHIATRVVEEAAKGGLALIHPTGLYGNVLRAMPPLTITADRLEAGLGLLYHAAERVASENVPRQRDGANAHG